MHNIIRLVFILGSFLSANSILACNGVFDPQTGICHQTGGYEIPGKIKSQTQPKDYWGAIAIDSVKGKTSGSSWGQLNKRAAEKEALDVCNDPSTCQIVLTFKNSCGAVATNGVNVETTASALSPIDAERKALASCNKKSSKSCHIWVKAKCSGVGY